MKTEDDGGWSMGWGGGKALKLAKIHWNSFFKYLIDSFLMLTIKQALVEFCRFKNLIDAFMSWQTSHHFIKVCQPWNWWSPLRFAWAQPPHVSCGTIGAWSRNYPPRGTWNINEINMFLFLFFCFLFFVFCFVFCFVFFTKWGWFCKWLIVA